MKITIREQDGGLSVYIPKKDLEAKVVAGDPEHEFGGTLTLAGGMRIYVAPSPRRPSLPVTLDAKKL